MASIARASRSIYPQINLKRTLVFSAPIILSALYRYAPSPRPLIGSFRTMVNFASSSGTGEGATDFGNFKLQQDFSIKYAPVRVSKWKSEKTGLSVVVGSHSAPVTHGHFAIASEIFDDTGRPHTLEHLIFLGSKQYPFKGVLDQLANRAGSDGTNAWTANDHTAYTMSTAGTEGFLKMLPIYVDHILHPTITDAGFVTEVHHINGEGEDAGVVYSEMQARENQSGDLMALRMQRMLYPQSSAYRSETGGLMSNLRVLTAQQIRDYHGQYYVPHNLCLLIDGAVPLSQLFEILNNDVEPMILSHLAQRSKPPLNTFKRPFIESSTANPLSLTESRTEIVEFMEEDESMGEINMLWLGPSPMDYRSQIALKLLGNYLTMSATSPLQKEFVEIPKPYCTGMSFYSEDRVNQNELSFYASDIPMKHLDAMSGLVLDKLKAIVEKEGIDMDKMGLVLRRDQKKLLEYMETSVSSVLSDVVIGDFLYGDAQGKDLPRAFEDLDDYAELAKWTDKDWLALLDQYYVSQPCLTVVGKPSAALSAKIDKDEKERIAKRKVELGEDKLKELAKHVEEAKAESDRPPPEEMLSQFPLTDPNGLTWVPVETGINPARGDRTKADQGEVQRHLDADGSDLPFQAHFAHVKSNFVAISALFDTFHAPPQLKPWFSVFQSALFALGVKRADGTELTFEEVIDQLNDLTVGNGSNFSFRYAFSETYIIDMKVETADYEKAIAWIRDLLLGVQFTKDRLEVILAKALQELPFEKRDGDKVASAWLNRLTYDSEKSTSEAANNLLNSLEFIPETVKLLEENPDEVISKLEEVRQFLLQPGIMRVSVRGNIMGLPYPRSALARDFFPIKEAADLKPLATAYETKTPLGHKPSKKMILTPMPAIEGSYSYHIASGPHGWDHPDIPALTLASSVLNAAESYLWKSIRGSGLAYGASIGVSVESGTVSYSVYRSPNAALAYEEAKKVLTGLADGSVELDQKLVDGARSSLTYKYARGSETVAAAASTAYLNEVLKGLSKDHHLKMLATFPSVTLDQIRAVIKQYLLPIFDSSTTMGAVSVGAGKADEVEKAYLDMGFDVERKELPKLGEDDEEGSGTEDDSMEGSEGEEASDVEMGSEKA